MDLRFLSERALVLDLMSAKGESEEQALRKKVAELEGRLEERRKYGLVWEEPKGETDDPFETEQVRDRAERELPLVIEEPKLAIGEGPTPHLLIEGDNYFTLSGLTFSHQGEVDVIYIDPPYNTGRQDFIYNDRFVKADDDYRHSKWLSFMAPRLSMAHELLKPSGVIFISIDDGEMAHLRLLMDQIFGEGNLIAQLIWKSKSGGASDSRLIAVDHEYVLAYAKDSTRASILLDTEGTSSASFNREDSTGRYSLELLDKQNLGYQPSLDFEIKDPEGNSYWPKQKNPEKPNARWRWSEDTVRDRYDELVFEKGRVYTKNYEKNAYKARSLLIDDKYGRSRTGNTDLAKILGNTGGSFSYPKPTKLIRYLLGLSAGPDALVLDFFAGSGTTAQAVMELNEKDGGRRQCILATNNENGICREVAHKRLANVINGYKDQQGKRTVEVEGVTGSLRFFTSEKEFIKRTETPDEMREAFRTACRDLIRIKEDCFDSVKKTKTFEVFSGETRKGQPHALAILYGLDGRDALIKELKKQPEDEQITIYAFSLHSQADPKPFEEALGDRLDLGSIPEQLLKTYERVFQKRLFGGWSS